MLGRGPQCLFVSEQMVAAHTKREEHLNREEFADQYRRRRWEIVAVRNDGSLPEVYKTNLHILDVEDARREAKAEADVIGAYARLVKETTPTTDGT